jgi:hypothetical protein
MGLEFAIAKTKAMVFSRRRSPATLSQPLLVNGSEVEVVKDFKYLGVTLDIDFEKGRTGHGISNLSYYGLFRPSLLQ